MASLTELQYHPPISFFAHALRHRGILLEACEHYQKQSYRNRCHVLTANGVKPQVVPVKHSQPKIQIREVQIDHSQRWTDIHWRTIRSAYGSAPYFLYYADLLEAVYRQKHQQLWDLNLDLLHLYLKLLNLNISIRFSSDYQTIYPAPVVDNRNLLHPKRQSDNLGTKPYVQVFGRGFVPDLSIMDLLFNLGPEAENYLLQAAREL